MSSTYYKLTVLERPQLGNKEAKKIRKLGAIPAVLYYAGEESKHISIDKSVFFHALQSAQRIYEIQQDKEKFYVMIKEIQYHPVTDEIIHVDLMRVRRSEKITIFVPLILVGESIGVKEGGILSQALNQIEISCYPTDVPEKIELNIENLELNSAKSVGDLDIDIKDVEIISDSNLNIVSITPPASEEEVSDEDLEKEPAAEDIEKNVADEKVNTDSSSDQSEQKSEN